MKYCLVDMSNLVFRARYGVKSNDVEDITGFAMHIVMTSMLKVYQKFGAHKMIACFDYGSWRKDVFPEYKAHRGVDDKPADIAIKENIFEMITKFHEFLATETNVMTLRKFKIEADDFIYHWIDTHPEDDHIIISTDSDFKQLIAPNVELFDGMANQLYRIDGIHYQDGRNPKKTDIVRKLYYETWKLKVDAEGNPEVVEPSWHLFEKIMKGDVSDNIPRVLPPRFLTRKLRNIYLSETGHEFSELMKQTRYDLEDKPLIEDLCIRNSDLIDLSRVPENYREEISSVIASEKDKPPVDRIGMKLLTFCRRQKLNSVAESAQAYAGMLAA